MFNGLKVNVQPGKPIVDFCRPPQWLQLLNINASTTAPRLLGLIVLTGVAPPTTTQRD